GDLSATSVVNEYGPTETVVGCCAQVLSPGATLPPGPVPIGRPIANLRVYLLDEHRNVVPAGIPGELHIGGAGVARGYLGRPDLTAESFVPDPCAAESGSRLYRSGDLARYLPDGTLEFLGRVDHQLKVRGFRIEPGEIEAVLRGHSGVEDAVVTAWDDGGGHKRLVAYWIPAPGSAPGVEELRRFLGRQLPDSMLPSALVPLATWPLTPHGKLDRAALPPPEAPRPLPQDFAVPGSHSERMMVEIWQQVLGRETVGLRDNFFELGGDSILGVQVVARARQAGLRLTPAQLFRHQTIAELVAVAEVEPVSAEQGLVTGPVPLTPIQRWFFEQGLADPGHWNQAVLLEMRGRVAAENLALAVAALIQHHDALRMRFRFGDSGWQQVNLGSEVKLPLARLDLSGLPAARHAAVCEGAMEQLQASLHLERGPLMRAALFDLGGGAPGRLLLIAHHLVVDGVSWRILLEDLELACAQIGRGEPVRLPAKTTSFREWALRLGEHVQAAAQAGLEAWREIAEAKLAPLPLDGGGSPDNGAAEDSMSCALDAETTGKLLDLILKVYRAQAHDALLAALVRVLCGWTGASEVLLEMERHGREQIAADIDLSRTVGWFTSSFPLLLRHEPAADFDTALRSVREQVRRCSERGIDFGVLRYLGDDAARAALAALPRPEVSFNYLGRFDGGIAGPVLFAPAGDSTGPTRAATSRPSVRLAVSAAVLGGRLEVLWRFGPSLVRRSTVARLAGELVETLRAVADGGPRGTREPTPADFPRARLSDEKLQRVLGLLDEIDSQETAG
ncbi:MAG TPA: condensation domain-containing protein, partial [Thermoanaerobaculia bacterium]|nr:condensation domain-containing protein [Thermoanaerobaculia bacterium]